MSTINKLIANCMNPTETDSVVSGIITEFKKSPDSVIISFNSSLDVKKELTAYEEEVQKIFGQAEYFINELCASSIEFDIDCFLVEALLGKLSILKEHYVQFKNKKDLNGESKLEKYIKNKNVNEIAFCVEFTTDEYLKFNCQIRFNLYVVTKTTPGGFLKFEIVMDDKTLLNLN